MKNRNTYATYFFAFLLEKFYVFIGIYIYINTQYTNFLYNFWKVLNNV